MYACELSFTMNVVLLILNIFLICNLNINYPIIIVRLQTNGVTQSESFSSIKILSQKFVLARQYKYNSYLIIFLFFIILLFLIWDATQPCHLINLFLTGVNIYLGTFYCDLIS